MVRGDDRNGFADMILKIMESDCIVLASPLYYWTISARLKVFMERFYCIAQPDPHPQMGRVEKYPGKAFEFGKQINNQISRRSFLPVL